jgi:hypothetical protein
MFPVMNRQMLNHRAARRFVRRRVATMVGMLDYFRFPNGRNPWGGPFNGQCFRQELFLALVRTCRPAAIIETGTYLGSSTEFIAEVSKLPVYSVESSPRAFGFAAMRLRGHRNVRLSLGDSREFLTKFIGGDGVRYAGRPVLFYLDAHWGEDLPLGNELENIFDSISHAITMIDDFQVPYDAGYSYDDYGTGKALTRDYIAPHIAQYRLAEFYPTTPSAHESGSRRGCVVLAHDSHVIDALSKIPLLGKWPT